jgi:hypothetical protein
MGEGHEKTTCPRPLSTESLTGCFLASANCVGGYTAFDRLLLLLLLRWACEKALEVEDPLLYRTSNSVAN